jgi:hypothetical protein
MFGRRLALLVTVVSVVAVIAPSGATAKPAGWRVQAVAPIERFSNDLSNPTAMMDAFERHNAAVRAADPG